VIPAIVVILIHVIDIFHHGLSRAEGISILTVVEPLYAWGGATNKVPIVLDNKPFEVT
jgi:hypothetical protein